MATLLRKAVITALQGHVGCLSKRWPSMNAAPSFPRWSPEQPNNLPLVGVSDLAAGGRQARDLMGNVSSIRRAANHGGVAPMWEPAHRCAECGVHQGRPPCATPPSGLQHPRKRTGGTISRFSRRQRSRSTSEVVSFAQLTRHQGRLDLVRADWVDSRGGLRNWGFRHP